MIERVARAILKRRYYDCEPDMYVDLDWFFWVMENESGDIWSDAMDEARVAIAEMREPTVAMIDSGVAFALNVSIGREYNWSAYVADKHRAMIDQALKDEA